MIEIKPTVLQFCKCSGKSLILDAGIFLDNKCCGYEQGNHVLVFVRSKFKFMGNKIELWRKNCLKQTNTTNKNSENKFHHMKIPK